MSKGLTDFNDLHVSKGLDAVAATVHQVFKHAVPPAVPPSPLLSDADQKEGVISQDEIKDDSEFSLSRCLDRFALLDDGSKVWDIHKKRIIKITAFRNLVTRGRAEEWLMSPKRKNIDQDAVDVQLKDKDVLSIKTMIDRYVFITESKEAWDMVKRRRVNRDHLRDEHPLEYDVWLRSPFRKQTDPDKIVFDPSRKCAPDCINTFDGLPLTVLDDDFDSLADQCDPIIRLLSWLCESDITITSWVLRWLAIPLQQQGAKLASALLIHGDVQGAGKSLFFDNVMRIIYGKYAVTLGQHQLEGQYNDWQINKLYAVFEEIFGGAGRHQNMGKVKHLITGKVHRIEKKFLSGWEESNHVNVVFLSNEHQPLNIEENDRRHLVCWPKRKLDPVLRNEVVKACDDPELKMIRAFYSYLMKLDLTGHSTHTEPPMTNSKRRIIDYGLPSYKSFYNAWRNGELNEPFCSCSSDHLYHVYANWCLRRKENPLSQTKFGSVIETLDKENRIVKAVRRYKLDGRHWQRTCILINEPVHANDMAASAWLSQEVDAFWNVSKVPAVLDGRG